MVAATRESLRGRLSPPEIFHEILEHRWYMSEAAGFDVGTSCRRKSYFPDGAAGRARAAQRGRDGTRRGRRFILTPGRDHGQPDQESQHRYGLCNR